MGDESTVFGGNFPTIKGLKPFAVNTKSVEAGANFAGDWFNPIDTRLNSLSCLELKSPKDKYIFE